MEFPWKRLKLHRKGKTGEKQAPVILISDDESDVGPSSTEMDVVRLCTGHKVQRREGCPLFKCGICSRITCKLLHLKLYQNVLELKHILKSEMHEQEMSLSLIALLLRSCVK